METTKNKMPGGHKKSVSDKGDLCPVCKKAFTKNDEGICCDLCNRWHHCLCEGMDSDDYKYLTKKKKAVKWFCNGCLGAAVGITKVLSDIQKEQEVIQDKLKQMDKKLALKLDEKQVKKIVKDHFHNKEMQDELKRVVRENINSEANKEHIAALAAMGGSNSQEIIAKAVKDILKDNEDAENRKNNIIIYRLKESEQATKAQQEKDDEEEVLKLLNTLNKDTKQENIVKCTRLGKKEDDGTAARPLLVETDSLAFKISLMKNLKSLKDSEWNVGVTHDYTKLQRMDHKKLVEKSKDMNDKEQGEYKYHVLGAPGKEYIKKVPKNPKSFN